MSNRNFLMRTSMVMISLLICTNANAGIVVTGTRLVYLAQKKEISVKLENGGAKPALVQAWIDSGDIESNPGTSKAPFVLSPPVFRIDPGKGQTMRMMFNGTPLPKNKESVFWLNVLEIPPVSKDNGDSNILQMAFRTRIKIFYRPEGLAGTPDEAMKQIVWRIIPKDNGSGYDLEAYNPTVFNVSEVSLALVINNQRMESSDGMIGPGETRRFAIQNLKSLPASDAHVEFDAINDYGAVISVKKHIMH